MTLTAIVVAGIPATISKNIIGLLKGRYSDGYVVRVKGFPQYVDRSARYSKDQIAGVLEASIDAVFGKTKRPIGFCRNADRGCSLHKPGKGCMGSEELGCSLTKPEAFFLFYQAGNDAADLLSALHYSSLAFEIPRSAYGDQSATFAAIVEGLTKLQIHRLSLSKALLSHNSTLYFPPLNFKRGLGEFLARTVMGDAGAEDARKFKFKHFDRGRHCYISKNRLRYTPADCEIQHGEAGPKNQPELALTRHFRVGVSYDGSIHYDVQRDNEKNLSGEVEFICRERGKCWPKERYVNILVDDCLR